MPSTCVQAEGWRREGSVTILRGLAEALGSLSFPRRWRRTRVPMFALRKADVIQSQGCFRAQQVSPVWTMIFGPLSISWVDADMVDSALQTCISWLGKEKIISATY